MKTEIQVCGINNATQLKKLGVKQDSLFYYLFIEDTESYDLYFRANGWWVDVCTGYVFNQKIKDSYFSAFTVGELGLLLPVSSDWSSGIDAAGNFEKEPYTEHFCKSYVYECTAISEANARAKQLIHLLKTAS